MIFNHPLAMLCFVDVLLIVMAGETAVPSGATTTAKSRTPEGGGEVTLGGIQGG